MNRIAAKLVTLSTLILTLGLTTISTAQPKKEKLPSAVKVFKQQLSKKAKDDKSSIEAVLHELGDVIIAQVEEGPTELAVKSDFTEVLKIEEVLAPYYFNHKGTYLDINQKDAKYLKKVLDETIAGIVDRTSEGDDIAEYSLGKVFVISLKSKNKRQKSKLLGLVIELRSAHETERYFDSKYEFLKPLDEYLREF